MRACTACGRHVRGVVAVCPHCAASFVDTAGRTAAVVLLGLTLAGCPPGEGGDTAKSDTAVMALYGVPDTAADVDDDADGWTESEGDCNDTNDAVHPDAAETAADGVDSNCNGDDDT